MSNPTEPVVVQFGTGRLVVGTGTSPVLPGAHLVIINPAVEAGPVGEIAHERENRTSFFGDEIVMAFPTFEQACLVADALCNVPLDREPGEFDEGATIRRAEATRPIVGIENRTTKEVFDIMCARIHSLNAQTKADHACEIAQTKARGLSEDNK